MAESHLGPRDVSGLHGNGSADDGPASEIWSAFEKVGARNEAIRTSDEGLEQTGQWRVKTFNINFNLFRSMILAWLIAQLSTAGHRVLQIVISATV
jgi:hypothetical protein